MRACAILTTILVAGVANADDKSQWLTPIDTKAKNIGVRVPKAVSAVKPTVFKTVEELSKSALFDKDAVEKLKKEVNFEKDKLVVFAWNGLATPRLTGKLVTQDKKTSATFVGGPSASFAFGIREPGRPSDQFLLFVVPKDARG